jgi:hypothetical protein
LSVREEPPGNVKILPEPVIVAPLARIGPVPFPIRMSVAAKLEGL